MHPVFSYAVTPKWKTGLFTIPAFLLFLIGLGLPAESFAHGVAEGDAVFIESASGMQLLPFIYLGAKHMVTGYDHLLFLFGVIFFLFRMKDVAIYVTLFAVGHSVTLLYGVLSGTHVNPYIVDAIIGLSVVYKALDNLGAFRRWFGFQPNTKAAVLIFGFFHGFGLATKLQDFTLSEYGLVANILAFNVGVEIGQLLALAGILIAMNFWRKSYSFNQHAFFTNAVLMALGFTLIGYQLTGYWITA
ncbi:MAG: HupE/UreJ family protein [Neptuniibacter sp.]